MSDSSSASGSRPNMPLAALTVALVLALAACAADQPDAPETASEATPTEEPEVAETDPPAEQTPTMDGEGLVAVSSVFPLSWLAAQVAPGAEVTFLGAGGADPHDLELSPGDRALLETAHVVLYMGDLDFQTQVERAVADATGQVVDVRAVAGDALIAWDHSHDDEHTHDDEHNHDDDEHNHGAYDPHLWFDAAVMAETVLEIGAAFAAADPDGAEAYRANAEALREELLALDAELDALLADCRFETAIVSHEAYAYLLEPRGLGQEGISGAGGHAEASPQRIAELSAEIQQEGIPAVLAEPLHGREDAEALAREAGVPLLTIDPLEIATDEHLERGYLELMREQAEQFSTALDCEGAG